MAPWLRLAALPSSLLLLISTSTFPASSQDLNLRWPYILPPDSKYYPEDEILIKRDVDIQQKLQRLSPTGVKKLSGDVGEKFYLEYWGFEEEQEEEAWDGYSSWMNTTLWASFDQPVRVGASLRSETSNVPQEHQPAPLSTAPTAAAQLATPANWSKKPAPAREMWDVVPTGRSVGMHFPPRAPADCDHNVINESAGPEYHNGDELYDDNAADFTFVNHHFDIHHYYIKFNLNFQRLAPSTPDIDNHSHHHNNFLRDPPLTCSTGFRSCPASLGGGCCPTDRQCGSANCPPLSTSSAQPQPPVRPTSLTTTVETTTTTATHSSSLSYPVTGCPTGFYACSAFYQGGCCQIGRNCDSTSCPAIPSTTLVSGSSLTIVAPTGSGITAPGTLLTGSCAHGWMTCAPSVGGGCCPSGYLCGSLSCSVPATVTGGNGVGKEAPTNAGTRLFSGNRMSSSWTLLLLGWCLVPVVLL